MDTHQVETLRKIYQTPVRANSQEEVNQCTRVKELVKRFEKWENAQDSTAETNISAHHIDLNVEKDLVDEDSKIYDYEEIEYEITEQYEILDDKQIDEQDDEKQKIEEQNDNQPIVEEPLTDQSVHEINKLQDESADVNVPTEDLNLRSTHLNHDQASKQSSDNLSFKLTVLEREKAYNIFKINPSIIDVFSEGVNCYAFVKYDSGMLKPIKIYVSPFSQKIYIIRSKNNNISSIFVDFKNFGKIECTHGSMNYLCKDAKQVELKKIVYSLDKNPHFVLWINNKESDTNVSLKDRITSSFKKKYSRSLVFIFDKKEERDGLVLYIESVILNTLNKKIPIERAEDWSLF